MDRKRAYTTFSPSLKKYLKNERVRFVDFLESLQERMDSEVNEIKRVRLEVQSNCSIIDKMAIDGQVQHLFMPDLAFCNWLVSCVENLDMPHIELLCDIVNGFGCIHFPTSSQKTSFCFAIRKELIFLSFSAGFNGGYVYDCIHVNGRLDDTPNTWYNKLLVGLGMYLSCFPDQIKPGIPDDLKHPNHFNGLRARTIGISEKVVMRDGPTPHYRVGHFRFLESDRYRHKKGQAVFVHGCFVKGKAETVLAIT